MQVAVEEVAVALGVGRVGAQQALGDADHPLVGAQPRQVLGPVDEGGDDESGHLLLVRVVGLVEGVVGVEDLGCGFGREHRVEPTPDPFDVVGEEPGELHEPEGLEVGDLLGAEGEATGRCVGGGRGGWCSGHRVPPGSRGSGAVAVWAGRVAPVCSTGRRLGFRGSAVLQPRHRAHQPVQREVLLLPARPDTAPGPHVRRGLRPDPPADDRVQRGRPRAVRQAR